MSTILTYDRADIKGAEYLRLLDAWGGVHFTSCVARPNGRWVGRIADVERPGDVDGRWKLAHLSVGGWRNYFVNSELRAHFGKAGLKLEYHPLEWEPQKAKAEFWEIDTKQVMQ